MPDAHVGMGCTIGSVIPTYRAIIPSAVGVDIGCGMMAAKTNIKAKDLPDNLSEIRNSIEKTIPLGAGRCHQKEYFLGNSFFKLSHHSNQSFPFVSFDSGVPSS